MKKRQARKNYKKTISILNPLIDVLNKMGWSFERLEDKRPVYRNKLYNN